MNPSLPALFFAIVFTATLTSSVSSQQCASMSGTPLNGCNVAGYNSTFPMPYNMSNRSRRWVSSFVSYILRTTATKNCSGLAQLGEMVVCAIFVPRCTDGKLNLPCKRVCAEFMSRCSGSVDPFWLEYYVGYCTLLPDAKPSSGKCFEPPGFDQHYNESSSELLQGKCNKLIFPWCQGLGYHHTIMKESTQITTYKHFYDKNFTNDPSVDKVFLNDSGIAFWSNIQRNYSACALEIKKMVCADLFPPCFPDEGTAFYTACSSTCLLIRKKCPIMSENPHLGNFFYSCEALAFGSSDHGFCKHSSWPKPLLWLNYFNDQKPKPGSTTPRLAPQIPAYVIAIAVVASLIVIGLAVGTALLWRQRKLPWFARMFKRAEDTKDIVEEEPQQDGIPNL